MRAAGIDLGTVRVGVAVADELGILAHPRPFLDGCDESGLLSALGQLARDEGITVFVVGLPREMSGNEGSSARRARRFAAALAERTGVEVELVDERLSTRQARRRLSDAGYDERASRGRIDSASAAVILQSWLDRSAGACGRTDG